MANICVQVPHDNGVSFHETIDVLLKVWKVIQGSQGGSAPMRGVCCSPEAISQLATFGPLNCVDLIFHPSGISLVTSPTAPDNRSLWIRTSALTASECKPGSYYSQVRVEDQRGSQSDEWTLKTSTGDWLHICLDVGGVSSVFRSWNLASTSHCGTICRRRIGMARCPQRYQL